MPEPTLYERAHKTVRDLRDPTVILMSPEDMADMIEELVTALALDESDALMWRTSKGKPYFNGPEVENAIRGAWKAWREGQ